VIGAVVLVDREQGAEENLRKQGIKLYSLIKMSDAAEYLLDQGLISVDAYNKIVDVIR